MEITTTHLNRSGKKYEIIWHDAENDLDLSAKNVMGVRAYCFYEDKLAIVYSKNKKRWMLPGGGVEPGETAEEAAVREVKEETNMRAMKPLLLAYNEIAASKEMDAEIVTFFVCLAELYGNFVHDPDDGGVTEIKLIEPSEYKTYFDGGPIGDHMMQRALEMKSAIISSENFIP